MEYFTIKKENEHLISCVREFPALPPNNGTAFRPQSSGEPDQPRENGEQASLRGVVIVVHGFGSSRDCATYQLLLTRFPSAGYGMVGIELPGHGKAESAAETLRIGAALDSIAAAEQYVQQHWPGVPVSYFASSFGAYLTALYISRRPHTGRKAFFRSAAVNMPELFIKEHPSEEEKRMLADLDTKGYFDTGADFGSPVRITREMYRDLETTDLFKEYHPISEGSHGHIPGEEHRIAMAHGEKDDVIDPAAARRFAALFGIPITIFEGEGHSLGTAPETPDKVADLAIALYSGR